MYHPLEHVLTSLHCPVTHGCDRSLDIITNVYRDMEQFAIHLKKKTRDVVKMFWLVTPIMFYRMCSSSRSLTWKIKWISEIKVLETYETATTI